MNNSQNRFKLFTFLQDIRREGLSLDQLYILSLVWLNEGITMPEIVTRTGIPQTTISSHVKYMSQYKEGENIQGLNLVTTTPSLEDRRRLSVYPTTAGKAFLEKLTLSMQGK